MARFPLCSTETLEVLNRKVVMLEDDIGGHEHGNANADGLWPSDWAKKIIPHLKTIVRTEEDAVDGNDPFLSKGAGNAILEAFVTIAALCILALDRYFRNIARHKAEEEALHS